MIKPADVCDKSIPGREHKCKGGAAPAYVSKSKEVNVGGAGSRDIKETCSERQGY